MLMRCTVDLPAFGLNRISSSGSLLAHMRRHVTFSPDTVFEYHLATNEYTMFIW